MGGELPKTKNRKKKKRGESQLTYLLERKGDDGTKDKKEANTGALSGASQEHSQKRRTAKRVSREYFSRFKPGRKKIAHRPLPGEKEKPNNTPL